MAEPNTIYKMTILAMLDQVDFPLSNTQISNFFLEQDYTDYFTVQQILSGLLDSELIRAESSHSNTQYYITSAGQDTLKFFGVVADFYRSTASGYDVRCQLKEKEISMIDLTIHVRTKAQAEAVCRNWKEQNMDIYTYLMDMLIQ
ncbi:MAG: hypothetical protein BHW44_05600 [Roseburia sp. 40_7]|nr:MAG: hypothetical protein BHW44_05600 [Roseburia sp. 40_7]